MLARSGSLERGWSRSRTQRGTSGERRGGTSWYDTSRFLVRTKLELNLAPRLEAVTELDAGRRKSQWGKAGPNSRGVARTQYAPLVETLVLVYKARDWNVPSRSWPSWVPQLLLDLATSLELVSEPYSVTKHDADDTCSSVRHDALRNCTQRKSSNTAIVVSHPLFSRLSSSTNDGTGREPPGPGPAVPAIIGIGHDAVSPVQHAADGKHRERTHRGTQAEVRSRGESSSGARIEPCVPRTRFVSAACHTSCHERR